MLGVEPCFESASVTSKFSKEESDVWEEMINSFKKYAVEEEEEEDDEEEEEDYEKEDEDEEIEKEDKAEYIFDLKITEAEITIDELEIKTQKKYETLIHFAAHRMQHHRNHPCPAAGKGSADHTHPRQDAVQRHHQDLGSSF